MIAALVFSGSTVFAQQGMGGSAGVDTQTSFYARNDLERKLQHELVCTCGCGHTNLAECRKDPCATSHAMRGQLAALIDQGKSHDEIIVAFVEKYGSEEMLASPRNQGFNRLAWLLPWTVGGGAAVAVGFVAVRWSRKHDAVPSELPAEAEADDRLDDELRNLD
jgi:cytochrome c-type biogenesis protein CcmH/NrfF